MPSVFSTSPYKLLITTLRSSGALLLTPKTFNNYTHYLLEVC